MVLFIKDNISFECEAENFNTYVKIWLQFKSTNFFGRDCLTMSFEDLQNVYKELCKFCDGSGTICAIQDCNTQCFLSDERQSDLHIINGQLGSNEREHLIFNFVANSAFINNLKIFFQQILI